MLVYFTLIEILKKKCKNVNVIQKTRPMKFRLFSLYLKNKNKNKK